MLEVIRMSSRHKPFVVLNSLPLLLRPCPSKSRGGALSVKTDDPSNDKDKGNKSNPSRPKSGKDQGHNNSQSNSKQDPKSKPSQNRKGKQRSKKLNTLGGYAGRVIVSNKRQPICIPAGMSKVIVGRTQDKLPKGSYMVEAMDNDNLPCLDVKA